MNASRYAWVALLMLRRKPVRSILSILGIFIGVLALLLILAIREGMRHRIDEQYRTEGASVFMVQPGYDSKSQKIGVLSFPQVRALRSLPGVLRALPRLTASKQARGADETLPLSLLGIDEDFFSVYRIALIEGRAFLPKEADSRQPVMILTESAARKLFPAGNALGSLVNVEGHAYEIIGVVAWKPEIAQRAFLSEEPGAFVPASWLVEDDTTLQTIEVRVRPEDSEDVAMTRIRAELSHGDPSREALYQIQSLKEMLRQEQQFSQGVMGTLLAIAAISLIVGGIGIANVMLTSVTERTREIGVRKALGARYRDILLQFLVEACLLSGVGGLTAALAAYIGVLAAPSVTPSIPLAFPLAPAAGCIVLTMFVGLVAGLYPASRAAARPPAEALRYE